MMQSQAQANKMQMVNRPYSFADENITDWTQNVPCNIPYPVLILCLSHFVVLKW
jgi:hypothetical protein